jgi:hypothetical protein
VRDDAPLIGGVDADPLYLCHIDFLDVLRHCVDVAYMKLCGVQETRSAYTAMSVLHFEVF